MRLGNYRRGHAAGWVKNKAANNNAVNMSAGVNDTVLRMASFYGQAKGFTYTNTTQRATTGTANYHCRVEFGDDWANTSWPLFYINNGTMYSTAGGWYAVVVEGRNAGPFTFTNNGALYGAGGAANGGVGTHAVYIYQSVAGPNRPIFINTQYGSINGGSGGGGKGGTGGTGGANSYTVYEPGPGTTNWVYDRATYNWRLGSNSVNTVYWAGAVIYNSTTQSGQGFYIGSSRYWYGAKAENYTVSTINYAGYQIRKTTDYVGLGGAGGAGGDGGKGWSLNLAGSTGNPGAAGAAGANGGGKGGNGGSGGSGGSPGYPGSAGFRGNDGAYGTPNSTTPAPTQGAAGAAGGATGYAIYAATPWGYSNAGGTINGAIGGGVAPS
jgi:hypothetical protein